MEVFKLSPFASSSSTTSTSSNSEFSVFQVGPDAPSAPRVEREHLFDKVVTPSDVGKLNRLVIPKQYAERYFPLEPSTADRGLTLSFEDRTGKQWQFRYSYWNSSQSYVITKGWSRFVKEKQLDAGDTVSFGRGIGGLARGRLYIDCRRQEPPRYRPPLPIPQFATGRLLEPWGVLFPSAFPTTYDAARLGMSDRRQPYFSISSAGNRQRAQVQDGTDNGGTLLERPPPAVFDSVQFDARGVTERKRVRLFGVNLECSEPADDG